MNTEAELSLSYYKEIADINKDHQVTLVRHIESGSIYIKKVLDIYNIDIFIQIKNHPIKGVPHIQQLIWDADKLFVIEEYISGDNLETMLTNNRIFNITEVRNIILQLCDILWEIHSLTPPIIHRDIKPGNIIISPNGDVYLVDFNAARIDDIYQPEDTILLGTKGYAAPEQYGFGSSDTRTDIYAVGMLMNTLLTGNVSRDFIAPGPYHSIIQKCLQTDRDKRYQSAYELKAAIQGRYAPASKSWRRYLPPGFRTGNIFHAVIAIIAYATIVAGLSGVYDDHISRNISPWPAVICMGAGFAGAIAFATNYLDIQQYFPSVLNLNRRSRILAITSICIGIVFFSVFITAFIEVFFLS